MAGDGQPFTALPLAARAHKPVQHHSKEARMADIKDPENTIIIELKDGPVVI